jgi:hypothetical protein
MVRWVPDKALKFESTLNGWRSDFSLTFEELASAARAILPS